MVPSTLGAIVKSRATTFVKLNHVVIDIGKREFTSGLIFVACSRVCQLQDLLFVPAVSFQRLASLANSQRLAQRKAEDQRLIFI